MRTLPYVVLTTAESGSLEWHAARRGKIGGTAAVDIICGADHNLRTFGSPLTQWMRLTGRATDDALADADEELKKILRWGHESEPVHRKLLAEETGGTFEDSPGVLQHTSLAWFAVTPDGRALLADRGAGSLELKAPTRWTARNWESGIPLPVQVQAAAEMAVQDTPFCLASALIPPAPKWAIVERDPSFEQFMLDTLGHFYEHHVLRDIPPPATYRPIDKAALFKLHPKDNGQTVELPIALEQSFETLRECRGRIDALEKEADAHKHLIVQAIGPNTEGRVGPYRATYKHQNRTVRCKACCAITSQSEFRKFDLKD